MSTILALYSSFLVFTALHGMQTRSSDENSVCLSVKRVLCDKMEKRSFQIFTSYERSFSLVFWEKEWSVEGYPFWSAGPRWSKFAHFEPIIARSASAVTPSEESSVNADGKSTTRFSMSPKSPRWTSYVVPKPPKCGSKTRSVRNLNNKLR